jgi:hypothetical protein
MRDRSNSEQGKAVVDGHIKRDGARSTKVEAPIRYRSGPLRRYATHTLLPQVPRGAIRQTSEYGGSKARPESPPKEFAPPKWGTWAGLNRRHFVGGTGSVPAGMQQSLYPEIQGRNPRVAVAHKFDSRRFQPRALHGGYSRLLHDNNLDSQSIASAASLLMIAEPGFSTRYLSGLSSSKSIQFRSGFGAVRSALPAAGF